MNIVTLTLNPAVDKSVKVDGLLPENKLICHSIQHQPGGGGINISRVLKRLNVNSTCVFTMGGDNGEFLNQELINSNIKTMPVKIQSWTRENLSVVDTLTNLQYRFGMPGSKLTENEKTIIIKTVSKQLLVGDMLVISGSLVEDISTNFYAEIIRSLATKKIKIILDTSGRALTEALKENVFLIKPNQRELAQLAGKEFLDSHKQEEFATSLVQAGRVNYVIVSLGSKGALIVSKDGVNYQTPPSVEVKSTIGAGDSMLAGIIYGLLKNESPQNILKWGIACGTAATMQEGTDLAQHDNINVVFKMINN
ncbi:MAG: 1-phosphofructokinase family hexose kinase [Ferruginibacter sp.]|nr:1-phosphofructokinase family hexose kinase [Ferruginibacter sp.]